jgi:hypothetical protein
MGESSPDREGITLTREGRPRKEPVRKDQPLSKKARPRSFGEGTADDKEGTTLIDSSGRTEPRHTVRKVRPTATMRRKDSEAVT